MVDGLQFQGLQCQGGTCARDSFSPRFPVGLTHKSDFMQPLIRYPSLPLRTARQFYTHTLPAATRSYYSPSPREIRRPISSIRHAQQYSQTDAMGKKDADKKGSNFQLKVPKGTRDCTSYSSIQYGRGGMRMLIIYHRGRRRLRPPRPNLHARNRNLQTPRRRLPRHPRLRAARDPLRQIRRRQQTHLRPRGPRRRNLLPAL